jgi:hypothetical protein
VDISSWTLDHARTTSNSLDYIDNSAKGILCYHPGYTLVEKLQTIVNKYRKEIESDDKPKNFMRQYYDVYCLLKNPAVRNFIGSEDYQAHKVARFRGADKNPPLSEHPALLLSDKNIRNSFEARYRSTSKLYYRSQPSFENIIEEIHKHLERL